MNQYKTYHDAIAYIEGLYNLPVKHEYMKDRIDPAIYIQRLLYFLRLVGNPHKGFKYIHVTGTAGKGTVSTMIGNALCASGYRTGLLTSPFVSSAIEKIKVDQFYIAPKDFASIVEYLKPHIDSAYRKSPYGRPSYFEIIFTIALLYFKKERCSWVVLEAGCGGRYDYTNVIQHSVVSVITNIDYDHVDIIGPTLKDIAYEKAGIIKRRSIFWTAETRPHLSHMFQKVCFEKKTLFNVSKSKDVSNPNQSLAASVCRSIGIQESVIKKAVLTTRLPCRIEVVQRRPLVVLDGAHNPRKIRYTLNQFKNFTYRKLCLVLAFSLDKDIGKMLEQCVPLADHIIITRFQVKERKCADPRELLLLAKKYARPSATFELFLDLHTAFERAVSRTSPGDAILVTGSFFLAGELRKKWFPEIYILKKRKSY